MEDPFFVVKEEVIKAVDTSKGLYSRWCELVEDPNAVSREEFDWTTNELRNSIRSIEWDLEDLDETVRIVEKNHKKFKITEEEVENRKQFVQKSQEVVKEMRDHMANPGINRQSDKKSSRQRLLETAPGTYSKYTRLENEAELSNQAFINDAHQRQQLMLSAQDEQLDMIGDSVGALKDMSHTIGSELDEQAVMLDDFAHELDSTHDRMGNVMKKVSKVLHMTDDKTQWITIIVLLVIMVIVILLFFIL